MILQDIRTQENIDHHAYKFVLEICMDRLGFYTEVALKHVRKELASENTKDPKGFRDIIPENIARECYANGYDVTKLPIATMFAFIQKEFSFSNDDMNKLRISFINYISSHTQKELLYEYVNTEIVNSMVRNQLKNRTEFKDMRTAIDKRSGQVTALFGKVLRNSPAESHFAIDSPSVLAYLTEYYNTWFGKGYGNQIKNIMTEKDFKISGAGDDGDDVDFLNYMPEEIRHIGPLKNFRALSYNVFAASKIMFSHKDEVFYDLWSRTKRIIAKERFKKLLAEMKEEFQGIKVGYSIIFEDVNYKDHENFKYRKGIYNEREDILNLFCAEFDNGLQIRKYEDVFNRLIEKDSSYQEHNARQMFSHKSRLPKGRIYSNPEMFLMMLLGYASVKAILSYCDEAKIDPLCVPSDIFRDAKVYARTPSFEDYLKTNGITLKLMEEAENEVLIPNLPTNDEVLKDILEIQRDEDFHLNGLARLKFSTIKELLTSSTTNDKSACVELNRAQEFKQADFCKIRDSLNGLAIKGRDNYARLLLKLGAYETKLTSQLPEELRPFQLYKGKEVSIGNTAFSVPTRWYPVREEIMKILNKQDISSFAFGYNKDKVGEEQSFYNSFRVANLFFNLSYRIAKMYTDICDERTTSINMFTKLERHRDIINLPTKISNVEEISKLLQNGIEGVDSSDPCYGLLSISMCQTTSSSVAEVQTEFIKIYNYLMLKMFAKPIAKVRKIRDEIHSSLKVNGAIAKSPFGKYHNAIMEKSKTMAIGIIANEDVAKNQEFMRKKAQDEGHPSNFIIWSGRAAYVKKGDMKYYVHTSGRLYCPQLGNLSGAITDIGPNDRINF